MNEQQRYELSLLADGLGRVPPDKFKMGIWVNGTLDPNQEGFDCDFAGCAVGWAPKFIPDIGLKFSRAFCDPLYRQKSGMNAVSEYFGIPWEDARFLFGPNCYDRPLRQITPEMVARRIRGYLDNFGKKGKVSDE